MQDRRVAFSRNWTIGFLKSTSCSAVFGLGVLTSSVLWQFRGITGVKDLEVGDTSSYYLNAVEWSSQGKIDPLWSPGYTATVGTMHLLIGDPFHEQIVLRAVFVLAIVIAVYMTARALVGPYLALAAGIALSANPVVFDALYTVHLYAAVFPLTALALVVRRGNYRLAALSVLVAGAFLARNEYLLLALLFGTYLGVLAVMERSFRRSLLPRTRRAAAITVFLTAIFGLVIITFSLRSSVSLEEFRSGSSRKHTLNVCQVYAFHKVQKHEWDGNPWLECQTLMKSTFGVDEPTLRQATITNPAAIREFILWNLSLGPYGLQLLTTGHQAPGPSPDYVEHPRSVYAMYGSIAVFLLAGIGVWGLCFDPVRRSLSSRRTDLFVLASGIAVLATIVALTQRPRPSYLLAALGVVCVFATIGMYSVVNRRRSRTGIEVGTLLAVALIAFALPRHYDSSYVNVFSGPGQTLLSVYRDAVSGSQIRPEFIESICPFVDDSNANCKSRD